MSDFESTAENGGTKLASRLPEGIRLEELQPALRVAMEALADGRDAVVVLSLGASRDMFFQFGAWVSQACTLVVSPDSVTLDGLDTHAFVPWSYGKSEADFDEFADADDELGPLRWLGARPMPEPEGEIIFTAPEEIGDSDFREAVSELPIGYGVVDHAERVSPLSHDKLTVYNSIPGLMEHVGRPPMLAISFDPRREVIDDMIGRLQMKDPVITFADIFRPNIQYDVVRTVSEAERRQAFERCLRGVAGPGVIHTGTVSEARDLVEQLNDSGIKAILWQNKMKKAERQEVEEAFRDGTARILVSAAGSHTPTDRFDVRFVLHASLPGAIDTYAMEAGRLSRDGRPGLAVLLYDAEDQKSQRLAAASHFPTQDEFERVYDAMEELSLEEREIPVKDINALSGVSYARAKTIVAVLKKAGYVRQAKSSASKFTLLMTKKTHEQLMEDLAPYKESEEHDRELRQTIIRYTRSTRCRAAYLREHFGEKGVGDCGICDVCVAQGLRGSAAQAGGLSAAAMSDSGADVAQPSRGADAPAVVLVEEAPADLARVRSPEDELPPEGERINMLYKAGDVVYHPLFGDGEVIEVRDEKVTVDFPGTGEKKLNQKHLSVGDRSRLPKKAAKAKSTRAKKKVAEVVAEAPAEDEAAVAVATEDGPEPDTDVERAEVGFESGDDTPVRDDGDGNLDPETDES